VSPTSQGASAGSAGKLGAAIESLRTPLVEAARGSFRGEDARPGLGRQLATACDRVLGALPEGERAPWSSFREALAGFDGFEKDRQAIELARGLRLCHMLGGAARPAAAPRAKARAGDPSISPLAAPLSSLPGIGPTLTERLALRGIETVEDLLWLVPRRYDDVRLVRPVDEVVADESAAAGAHVALEGRVHSVRFARAGKRRWLDVRLAALTGPHLEGVPRGVLGGGSPLAIVRWFNVHPGMAKQFEPGDRAILAGKLTRRGGMAEMANPEVLAVVGVHGERRKAAGIIPRYPEIDGVAPAILRKAAAAAVARAGDLVADGLPAELCVRLGLPPLRDALKVLHAPPDDLSIEAAQALARGDSPEHRRLAFEELFLLGLVVARRKRARQGDVAAPLPSFPRADIERALPFAPTGAQRRAFDDLERDLARPVPMNRLLQGDVGAGKTAVAFAAIAAAAASGKQAALMAPTEILAEQHAATLTPWCAALGLKVALLTASTPRGVRTSTLALLGAGQLDLVIGTHALIAEGVVFASLGVVVIDEQHRFGVAQRVRLRAKSDDGAPHLLVMTATPIPRTLALTAYGDLDVSVLDELPPGRVPPTTRQVAGATGSKLAIAAARARLAAGEKVYWVCPLVEPPEGEDARVMADVASTSAALRDALAPIPVGVVTGRLPQAERDAAMKAFAAPGPALLCATTVIEVGVDVAGANLMVIDDAAAFGLSQLHQLRGRIGRRGGASECLLVSHGTVGDVAQARLDTMVATADGFMIAEEDLRQRGPGELLGVRQAGLPRLRFGDLVEHAALLVTARAEAEKVIEIDPDLARPEHAGAREALERRVRAGEAYGPESG
jgi:ATP-dependent DNA helicase RecG